MDLEGAAAPEATSSEDAPAPALDDGAEASLELPTSAEAEAQTGEIEVDMADDEPYEPPDVPEPDEPDGVLSEAMQTESQPLPPPPTDESLDMPAVVSAGQMPPSSAVVTETPVASTGSIPSPVPVPATREAPNGISDQADIKPSQVALVVAAAETKPSQAALAAMAAANRPAPSPPTETVKRQPRVLNTRSAHLRSRVDKDPTDGDAWISLIDDAQFKGDLEKTRELYEEFFRHFPDAARQWINYATLELEHTNFDRVEAIFTACLRHSTAVDLWRFYITYLRRRNPIDPSNGEKAKETRAIIASAFEFSLTHIGIDREAGAIWQEYIAFLRESEGRGQWEEQQKMDALRRTYQRAVCIPLNNVEEIWGDYNQWENDLNKMTARKFIGEKSAAYTSARLAIRAMRPMLDAVAAHDALPRPPDWSNSRDRMLRDNWKAYLAWEEGNPLQFDDVALLQQRVLYAYRKATVEMRFYPELWFSAASYARSIGKVEETVVLFKAGMSANPNSLLLHFGNAELEESKRNYAEAHSTYDALHLRLQSDLDGLNTDMEQEASIAAENAAKSPPNGTGAGDDADADDKPNPALQARQAVLDRYAERIQSAKSAIALVWINQIRFSRRSEGKAAARAVFGRARKAGVIWQVYEAAAMVEYHLNKEPKVASNVFELGLKQFDKDVAFVLRYLEYLININDDANARAVFERTISGLPAEAAPRLWERWSLYECEFGDLAAIQKLDERILETYPAVKPVSRFAERTGLYLGIDELVRRDLGTNVHVRGRSLSNSRSRSRSPPPYRRKRSKSPIPPPRKHPLSPDGRVAPKRSRYGRGRSPSPPVAIPRRTPLLAPSASAGMGRRPLSPPRRHTPPPQPPQDDPDGLPESISFFLRILPSAASFSNSNGPVLDGHTVAQVIATAQSISAAASRARGPVQRSLSPPSRRGAPQRVVPQRPQGMNYGQGR